MDTSELLWGVLFGGIAIGYMTYGHRQKAPIPLLAGIALLVTPYLVSNEYALVAISIFIMAIPYFFSI